MADWGYLSDTDDSAVEELISQVKDLSVLEQVSKINCSGFTDSLLPTDLDTRFRKLKSFNTSKVQFSGTSLEGKRIVHGSVSDDENDEGHPSEKGSSFKDGTEIFSDTKQNPDGKLKESPNWEKIFSLLEENPDGEKGLEKNYKHGSYDSSSKSKSGSSVSPLGSSNSFLDSPPKKTGCFWCSPKKKKNRENLKIDWAYKKDDDFLSVLDIFSYKEQKKAIKEEEKINKEAEKIVKWAKQASNRMSFHGIEDEVSDDDKRKL
ncbi:uncharacterized protein LOC8280094 [Ricinus communis]|uniref:Uncharacterized protein n=1 Tax=Ricinus communis TaxID=3988 RepID=B9S1M6_RICCO|nr:uncharacterized protein LOC8280094 [Ricinus communis]EEF42495.1 conserved hypothetical protein [Ricinus communis]|eukprot:XP_002519891.1 uncharacterized protein LOC8280094 [Ricinus communis]